MNGVEVARTARRLRPGLKILLTSGYADDVLSHNGVSPDELLVKPYNPSDLVERIGAALGLGRPVERGGSEPPRTARKTATTFQKACVRG
jgi:two-component SAPR family response regulator